MKGTLAILMLLIALDLQAENRLAPTPEAGLWRSESRLITDNESSLRRMRSVQPGLAFSHVDYRILHETARRVAQPKIELVCLTPSQASELGSHHSLHNILQRKLPECDLSLQKIGRSIVQVRGDCQDPERFNGKMEGLVEFVSTQEIHASFLGRAPSPGQPESNSPSGLIIQQHEVHRWASPDCGQYEPHDRMTF